MVVLCGAYCISVTMLSVLITLSKTFLNGCLNCEMLDNLLTSI